MYNQDEYWKEYIDIERSTPGRYVFNGKDRMYCVTGKSQGSLKRSELRTRIKEDRIRELPRRFQDFFDDIALMKNSDVNFLSGSEKKELWNEIIDVESHATKTFNVSFKCRPNKETKFGFELGALVRDTTLLDTVNDSDLIWGIILGLHGWPDGLYDQEKNIIEDIITDLNYKRETRTKRSKTEVKAYEELDEELDKAKNKIIDKLNNEGVDVDHVPFETGLNLINKFHNKKQFDNILNKFDLEQLKWNTKLRQIIEMDGNKMIKENWRGEKAESIINELWLLSKTQNNNPIKFEDMNTPSNKNTAMKLINQYSSVDKHKDVIHYPVIDETSVGYRLTAYGQLISFCFFENNGGCEWIERYNILRNDKESELSDRKLSIMQDAEAEIDTTID